MSYQNRKIPEIDSLSTGFTDHEMWGLGRDIERGCARFWAKRGGNPEPNWRAASKRDWKTRNGMEDEE